MIRLIFEINESPIKVFNARKHYFEDIHILNPVKPKIFTFNSVVKSYSDLSKYDVNHIKPIPYYLNL